MNRNDILKGILNEDINRGIDVHNYSHIMIDFETPPLDPVTPTNLYKAPEPTLLREDPAYSWKGRKQSLSYSLR